MFRYFDTLSRNLFNGFREDFFSGFGGTDIEDNGDAYTLTADLPGFKKEEISIDLNGDLLTLTAEHKEETDSEKTYIRRERRYGAVKRTFDISGIRADEISAQYQDGVLRLTLPKKTKEAPVSHRIEIQ